MGSCDQSLKYTNDVLLVAAYWHTNLTLRQLAPLFGIPKSAADHRDVPIALIGAAGGALALGANAPVEIAIPVAVLIVLDVRVRRPRRRT